MTTNFSDDKIYDYEDDDGNEDPTSSPQMIASAERCIVDTKTLEYRPSFPISIFYSIHPLFSILNPPYLITLFFPLPVLKAWLRIASSTITWKDCLGILLSYLYYSKNKIKLWS